MEVVVRMPPSPTGSLHLGTARTALFNYLFAKKNGGKVIFRWEDTDKERSEVKYETEILEGLKWLGMDFAAEAELHRQSENEKAHHAAVQQLWKSGKIFPCFVTPEDVQSQREQAAKEKTNFVFWSQDRDLNPAEAETRMQNERFVWRLRVERDQEIKFQDIIRGEITINTSTIGDFAIARADDSVLYLLANVVDDHQQGVTHVLRGEDGISNTPKQLLLFQALKAPAPQYGHIPLVLDQNKRKLSKRNVLPGVCVLIKDFQAEGFIPEAVINGLAFLGWNPKSTQELFSFEELIEAFDLKKVNPGAAQYDWGKMKWYNAKWLRSLPLEQVVAYYEAFSGTKIKHPKSIDIAREKAHTLAEMTPELQYLEHDPGFDPTLLPNEKMGITPESAKETLQDVLQMMEELDEANYTQEKIKAAAVERIETLGVKVGVYLSPFRLALSGTKNSAGPFEIAEVLGKEEALRRLRRATA